MKQLYLIRHAKAISSGGEFDDYSRPLEISGSADAKKMSQYLKDKACTPDLIISSSAIRAKDTALIFAETFGIASKDIHEVHSLYLAPWIDILKTINEIDDQYECVMLFGHSPGIPNCVSQLGNEFIQDFPTCTVAHLKTDQNHWRELGSKKASLEKILSPEYLK